MTREVVTCDASEPLQTAAERMLADGVGSVLITKNDLPVAIVTERDLVHAGAVTGRPFEEIPVDKAASHPLITVAPDATIRTAVKRLTDNDVKKLPVVDGMDLVGILTRSDIVAHHSDFIKEARQLDAMSSRWEPADGRD